MSPSTHRPLGAILTLLACFAPATAQATDGAREAGTTTVRAQLRFIDGQDAEVPVWRDLRLSVRRNDEVIASNQPLPSGVAMSYFRAPKLLAIDLDDDAEPELLVDVYTAGVSCCQRSAILKFDGQQYRPQIVDWDAGGYTLRDVGGGTSPEFLTEDTRFPRLFANAQAAGPLRILRLGSSGLRDVSASVPARLARDARAQKRALRKARRRHRDTRAPLAAYVVDLVRLGQLRTARREIAAAARRRELHTTRGGFARRLDARMVAWGYQNRPVLSGVATPVGKP